MGNVFAILSFIAEVMPLLLKMIGFAESHLGAGKGAAKFAVVLGTVEAAASAAGKTAEEVVALRGPITAVINSTVQAFNQFKAWPAPQGD